MLIQLGVPQGRPSLLIMYMNDLPLGVKVCSVELYADDTRIFFVNKAVRKIEAIVNLLPA